MTPVFRSLTLRGFRSFDLARIDFANPTFLVGRNAVGKTNLVDALAFLQEATRHPLEEVVRSRGGIRSLVHRSQSGFALKVEFGGSGLVEGHYGLEIEIEGDDSFKVVREQCRVLTRKGDHWFTRSQKGFSSNLPGEPFLHPQALVFPVFGGLQAFRPIFRRLYFTTVFQGRTELMRRPQKVLGSDRLSRDWSNAADVLLYLEEKSPATVRRIGEILSAVTPAPVTVRPRVQGGMVSLEFEQQNDDDSLSRFDAVDVSEGTLQVLALLLAVFQRSFSSLLVFEEPEANVFPGTISVISDLLLAASKDNQVLATTHSPDLLDAKWISDRHLRLVFWEADASRLSQIGKASREALRERLMGAGELLRSSALDQPPLERAALDRRLFEALS